MSAQPTPHASDDRLIDLAHGLLDPDASSACLAHVSRCDDCEARFRAIAGERARLVAHAAPAPVARRSRILVAASIAALLLFAAVLRFGREGHAGPSPYWLPIDREQAVLRSSAEAETPGDLSRALAAYEQEDAALAVRLLTAAEVPAEYEPLRNLYLASALELDGQATAAAAVLDRLYVDTLPEPWRTQGRWVAYATARARGENDRAAALLERIAHVPGEIGELARRERDRWRR